MLKDIVAIVDNDEQARDFILNASLFAHAQEAHLAITILSERFWDAALLPPYEAYAAVFDEIEAQDGRRAAGVLRILDEAAIPAEVRSVADSPAYLSGATRVEARYADLLLSAPPSSFANPKLGRRCIEGALMSSAGPILLLPDESRLERIDHAVLGWDASGEARRAARDLLTLLEPGARIDVITVDAQPSGDGHGAHPGTDIARHLARHGFTVEVHQLSSGGRSISTSLETFALETGANILAIGAFAHSRVRDIFLGGVTRSLLDNVRMPLLLSR
ncbi:universal stress protein [Tardiphaga sp.]|uniref:universal stress protein n=1 Tax=Tardiphaga sp. TaxID=1926292 RepID=UPI00352B4701